VSSDLVQAAARESSRSLPAWMYETYLNLRNLAAVRGTLRGNYNAHLPCASKVCHTCPTRSGESGDSILSVSVS
jgi:hypothetical protein